MEDHFDRMSELESLLEAKGKLDMLDEVRRITDLATFHFTRQGAPLGLGHAVLMAKRHVGDEPFAVLLPDEIMPDGGTTLRRMIDVSAELDTSVVSLREVADDEISAYGCAGPVSVDGDVVEIGEIVEKPEPADAPSNLAVTGRYVFQPEIFNHLEQTPPGKGGEIQLTDAMAMLIGDAGLHGVIIEKAGFDAGQKLEWLRANIELSLDDPAQGGAVAEMLSAIVRDRGLA
jgi:UTP--glucose-1-phosphate uridylyltransferase